VVRVNTFPPDPRVCRWLNVCGGALLLLVATVLIGRFAGIKSLVTIVPDGAPMSFPTVMGFLLAGVAFVAHGTGRPGLARVVTAGLLLLGAGTLVIYVTAEPLGWKRFIYDPVQPVISEGVGFDGRMSPNAAVSFAFLACALWLLSAARLSARLAACCIALLLAIALFAIVNYTTGLRFSAAWWRYSALAVHSALAFLVATMGLLYWLMRRMAVAEKAVMRTVPFLVVAGTAVTVLAAVVLVSNEHRLDATRAMNHTLGVEAAIDRFIASVARLESSTRAFGVTGEESYLERIQVHRESVKAAADALVRMTADNPPQHVRARALLPLIEEKFRVNDAQVRARRTGGVEAAAAELRAERPELMAGLRAATTGLQAEEHRVLNRRRDETSINEARLQWVLLVGAVVCVGLVGIALTLVYRAHRELQHVNDQLELRVRERTGELEASTMQLKKSEQRLRFLADKMPQLVWTVLPDGRIENLNQGWLEYLGAANEEEGASMVTKCVHPDELPAATLAWRRMRDGVESAGGELRLRRADGVYRWHLWRSHPERDAQGRVVRWVGTCTDIQEQKRAEEQLEQRIAERTAELRASEERFRQAFEFAGIGMAIVGLDGRWVRVNKSICEIVGYSQPELVAKTFQDITHPDDLAADLAHVKELIAGTRRSYQMEKRYIHRDGHLVWVRLTVSIVRAANNDPVHFVSQIEDITERKRLEESLANARDQALESSRLKSEFLATMSHEIRTPMNGVIGMTSLLRDTPLTAAQAEYVRTIESSGESLLSIINDILDYSKIEAGRIELETSPFDLRQCMEDSLDLFAARAVEKKIELVCRIGPEVPRDVVGDAARLRQILVNLIGNALKFTESGEIVVSVEGEAAETRQRLRFAVRDTGIGIASAGMERLFKSFSQVDASTTRRFGGTGLGLAISKRLVEAMDGKIWAESEPGKGSTFHFTIVVDVHPDTAAMAQFTLPELVKRRLLVVDDNPISLRVIGELARSWGMIVHEVSSGREALDWLGTNGGCDVAVIDLHMPGMDGDQLAVAIHAQPELEHVPLVLLTALGRPTRSAEFVQLVSKPVKADALRLAIRAGLRRQTGSRSRDPFPPPGIDSTLGQRCPLRLLIAEDNAVNRRVASLLLERLGYRPTTVVNGLEAVTAIANGNYDAILMDVEMPELDGCEATRRIRTLSRSATRPWIIALTAGATQAHRDRAMGSGMNDFLTKPVRTESISGALERAHAGLNGSVLAREDA
jgi:PAS domain S-box-containing protein